MTVRRVPFALCVLASVVVLFAPGDDVPGAPPGVDKLVHVGLFAMLALTGSWARLRPVPLGAALACYAVASELVQAYAPISRDGSPADALVDLVGLLAAFGLVAAVRRRARVAGVRSGGGPSG